jgi:hypothetical protein
MNKISFLILIAVVFFAACSKRESTVSVSYTPSYPVVTFTNGQYFSIPLLGTVPTISATAYDTFYKQPVSNVVIDYSHVDITQPGYDTIFVTAKNQNGFITVAYAYVAVIANINSLINLAGPYISLLNGDTTYVTRLSTGVYQTNNVAGVHSSADSVKYITKATFVQLSNTQIVLPQQVTTQGLLYGINASCTTLPADTTFSYQVINPSFGAAMRRFQKVVL